MSQDIVKVIADYGIAVGVIIYFMWYNSTVMKDMKKAIQELTIAVQSINKKVTGEDENS